MPSAFWARVYPGCAGLAGPDLAERIATMVACRYVCWAAVLVLAAGWVVSVSAQTTRPAEDPIDRIAERLKERGIDLDANQVDRARKVMNDLRDGVEPDPEQIGKIFADIRKQIESRGRDRLKEMLGASDEEWKILSPMIEKVRTLSASLRADVSGFRGMRFVGGGDQESDIQRKARVLQDTLENKASNPAEIAAALKAYRAARAQGKVELSKARKDLRGLLTVKQEAQLVTMDLLD